LPKATAEILGASLALGSKSRRATSRIGGGLDISSITALAGMLAPREEIPITLKIEDSAQPPPLSSEESYVKIGDRVRQIRNTETEKVKV
jgi:hypothetical protein